MAVGRRKGWDALSTPQRRRYERAGVTRSQYESGAGSLAKARGHGTSQQENARQSFLRSKKKYVEHSAEMLGRDYEDQLDDFNHLNEFQQGRVIQVQAIAQQLHENRDYEEAHRLWAELQAELDFVPWWLMPYRGEAI